MKFATLFGSLVKNLVFFLQIAKNVFFHLFLVIINVSVYLFILFKMALNILNDVFNPVS